ncbi:MAG: metallophosphoesterase, partial [Crocinitomicaceae bacterium]|nr:metallophosphoesterase [Crocinitomicaceae bacterium]
NENEFYTYKLDPSYFVSGINTIAISLRNRSSSDADLSFDCYLTPDFLYKQDGPYVSYNGSDIIVEEVTPGGVVSNTYTSSVGLQLTCELPHMNTSFTFPLKTQITTEPSEYLTTPSKFLTISDFDGHIEGLTMVLTGEGVIDDNFNWTYGNGHLIISGDLFDRGFHVTECMWLLYKLESEAEAAGGKMHLIIGNHEMFNMTDDWRYVEVKYFDNAHLMGKRMPELYDPNTELGRWLRSKNIIERIGDYAFTHGGISPEVSALNLTYDQINNFGRMEMNGTCTSNDCIEVNGSEGLYWYRGMVEQDLTQQEVDNFVTDFGVGRVIIGHTKDNTILSLYDGRVIAIDMYHVDNFSNGYMEALQFELGCFYIFYTTSMNQTYTLLDDCDNYTNVAEINGAGQIQIYPNPTVSKINIVLPADWPKNCDYSIVNQMGEVVSSGKIKSGLSSIDVSAFTAGKYILSVKSSTRTMTGYFILKT